MLEIDRIDVYYGDQALWKASLTVQDGEIAALVGSKTVLERVPSSRRYAGS